MKVLVTGGTGLVGSALQKCRPDWTYVDSKTYGSLTEIANVRRMFDEVGQVDAVVHLAANVGGMFKNMNKPREMIEENLFMNSNILSEAANRKVPRVIDMLSTCVFPNGLDRPITPEDLHLGPPHPSNEGYAHAKRLLEVHSRVVRESTDTWVTCLIPTNVYGPHDNFSLEDGHVIPALVHRASIAKRDGVALQVKGTGAALRQFIHSDDLARIVAWAVETPSNPPPMVVCCTEEEYTIGHVAKVIAEATGVDIEFVPGADGQMRKTAASGPGDFPAPQISLEDGLVETVKWFNSSAIKRI
jgi:GDP-L-fucose synthase